MGKIHLLSDALASQVAAGEVVERPASVVKELVENSIDAGAKNIEVRVQRGGIALIRVADDGCGMNRDDALMCVERHATSKLKSKEDLGAISTLGFRGEALPSIASVSKFRLTTREAGEVQGTEVTINGGKMVAVKDGGEPPGTQIEIRSLFYNVPARRKFLRTENTEYSHVEQQVRLQAIAHPECRFALVRGERLVFQLPATDQLLERIRGLAGNALAGELLAIEPHERNGVRVHGYIGPPGMGRPNRTQQLVFLNGRPVEAGVIHYGLREGYHTALMKGQHPVTFLFIEIDPSKVDVNVHPAKKEVRFHDGNSVRDAVIEAVQKTLQSELKRPVSGEILRAQTALRTTFTPDEERSTDSTSEASQGELIPQREQHSLRNDWAEKSEGEAAVTQELPGGAAENSEQRVNEAPADKYGESSGPKPEDFRILGVLGKLYVLMESKDGLALMDQHAAHERVLFEEMKKRMEEEGVPTQRLLIPVTVELPPNDLDLVTRNLDVLERLGIVAEPFGGSTLKIDSLPTFFRSDEPLGFIYAVIEELQAASSKMSDLRLGEDLVATTVCRHAVKANDKLQGPELDKLLEDLLECEMPYCCPHGRPTLIQISYGELEKKFGRRA
ncbi:MAG: DNA mismatch repair endonuclease MutL [Verrucomicrobia bacterium]|nr:DNA mismatch repair endonuclease MutL [Verrucomicrobiota bacterium]